MNELKQPARAERVTIRTVAADAGVSVAAVSKVLRNAYGVSDALRQNVLASIERLGYRPSTAARGMRGQTYTIGILLVEMANPFLPQVIAGVHDVLGPSNYKALMGIGESDTRLEATLIESMIDNRMDGLILVAPRMRQGDLARFAAQVPISVIGHHEPMATTFDTVNSDDFAGAGVAVRALFARGLTDIAMVSLDDGRNPEGVVQQREDGYLAAMAALGLADSARILRLPYETHTHAARIAELLRDPARPRAMFCWSDLDAIGIVNAARMMGLDLPRDLALIGYDNSSVAALPLIGLSSIDQSGRLLGSRATEALLSRIAGRRDAMHVLIPPVLSPRMSH